MNTILAITINTYNYARIFKASIHGKGHHLAVIEIAIVEIRELERLNAKRPIEGDLFCPPVPNYHPTFSSSGKGLLNKQSDELHPIFR